jgi:hypothetical protein
MSSDHKDKTNANEIAKPKDMPQDYPDLNDIGSMALQGNIEVAEFDEPAHFGTFAHTGYELNAYHHFDDVELERQVRVTKPDGTVNDGKIDLVINENRLFDYKTGSMQNWDDKRALSEASRDGRQMYEYIHSPDTPTDSIGTIVRTVPSKSASVCRAYEAGLIEYGVNVIYSPSEEPDAVTHAIEKAIVHA